jgi:hypothetical protein
MFDISALKVSFLSFQIAKAAKTGGICGVKDTLIGLILEQQFSCRYCVQNRKL